MNLKNVSAAIIKNNDCIFLARRSKGQNLSGYWEFPGGKQEIGETIQECLVRELKEELQISVKCSSVLVENKHVYERGSINLIAVETEIIEGDIMLSVHDKFEWVKADDILSYNLAPADIPIAKWLKSQNKLSKLSPGDILLNDDLCETFLCSTQGGMRRSNRTNTLLIISDHVESIYEDRWIEDVLHYTGMGKKGDQSLSWMQNKTLNESLLNAVDLHLFEVFESSSSKEYTYTGEVVLSDNPYQEIQNDEDGNLRNVWVFPLKVKGEEKPIVDIDYSRRPFHKKTKKAKKLSDSELKKRASAAKGKGGSRVVSMTQYDRDPYISELSKRLANGICQLCQNPAPFKNKEGEPFLESHHIEWLSDGGEDTIENTVALCPNCHRKMHIQKKKDDVEKLKLIKSNSKPIFVD